MRIKVSLTISPIYNGSGIIMGASVIARNITEQKKAEQQLVQSEEKYRLLFEKSPQPMWIFDIQTLKFLEVNLAAIEHYGYSRQEFLQMTVHDVRPMESNPALKDLSNLDYSKTYSNFSIHRKKNGELIKVQISVSNIEYENRKATLVLLIDRTEQERTRKELLNINSQLRELTAHLHNIREEERTHIAREIHDELGQQLSALKMDIEWVISKMPRQEGLIEERVADLLSLIGQTVNSVRRISTNLRPAILDDLGLLAALEWQSSEAEKRSGININLTCNLTDVTLPLPITTGLFRIYQEALTNVVRHSSAKQVDAKLIVSENMIILQIADNGKGIVTEPSGKTFGLIGMKERAYILNGNIEIQSKPGKGTTIMVSIPHHSSN
jgi:PAS domain S-box-containing protein